MPAPAPAQVSDTPPRSQIAVHSSVRAFQAMPLIVSTMSARARREPRVASIPPAPASRTRAAARRRAGGAGGHTCPHETFSLADRPVSGVSVHVNGPSRRFAQQHQEYRAFRGGSHRGVPRMRHRADRNDVGLLGVGSCLRWIHVPDLTGQTSAVTSARARGPRRGRPRTSIGGRGRRALHGLPRGPALRGRGALPRTRWHRSTTAGAGATRAR